MKRHLTLLLALALLLGLFLGRLDLAAALLAVWLFWLGLGLRRPLRAMIGSPKLWGFTALVACLAGFFLGPRDLEVWGLGLSSQGLLAGVWMLLRGTALFSVFSVAATALTQGRVLGFLPRLGLEGAAVAVRAAVTALPTMQARLKVAVPGSRAAAKGLGGFFRQLENAAVVLLREALENARASDRDLRLP